MHSLVKGHLDEVGEEGDRLIHVDLVGGGQALVELVVDAGQDGLDSVDA